MTRQRGKKIVAKEPSRQQTSVVVGTDVDRNGMVSVIVTGPRGKFRYRVPAEPLAVPARTG